MSKPIFFAALLLSLFASAASAQTIDVKALVGMSDALVRQVYDVCRYVKLDPEQQHKLALALQAEDAKFVDMVAANDGVLTVADSRKLEKGRHKILSDLLSEEQLEQYYRGVFDKEADAEGIAIADRLQRKYGLTDQNWKFIRVAFYKIGLDSRVINKMMADKPAKAKKKIEQLRREQLATIEAKGGIRVNDAGTTVTIVKPFDPNALHRE